MVMIPRVMKHLWIVKTSWTTLNSGAVWAVWTALDSGVATMSGVDNYMEEKLSYTKSRIGVTRDIKAKKELALIPCQAKQ